MPLPCVRTENRVKELDKVLVQIIKNDGSYRLTPHYARMLQRFVDVSVKDQEKFTSELCSVCRGKCCNNVNYLHLADVLRFYFSVPMMRFIPEFETAREIEDKRSREEPCKYHSDLGCILNRRVRPLVCVQFICKEDVVGKELLTVCKSVRRAMEDLIELFHIEIGKCDSERLEEVTERLQSYEDTLAKYEMFGR